MDYHMHSSFSLDSKMPLEAAVQKCVLLGYERMAFTEHLDIDFPGYGDKFSFDADLSKQSVIEMNEKYPDIDIVYGLEAGVTKDTADEIKEYIKRHDFEYVVLSNHIVFGEDPYSDPDVYYKYTKSIVYGRYLEDILSCMNEVKDFDTLGHYDYITRYAAYRDPDLRYEEFREHFDAIFRFLISNDKSLEINTATFSEKKYGKRVFDTDILNRYKELGGKNITIGSDAHDPDHIGFLFDHFIKLIRFVGFEYLTYFKNKEKITFKI